MTTVVNIRFQKYDVYIGRAGHGFDGYFGNPHPIGLCSICKCEHTRHESVSAFRVDFEKRIKEDCVFRERVEFLRGKVLGCFCKHPKKDIECHGDVYVEWLEKRPASA